MSAKDAKVDRRLSERRVVLDRREAQTVGEPAGQQDRRNGERRSGSRRQG